MFYSVQIPCHTAAHFVFVCVLASMCIPRLCMDCAHLLHAWTRSSSHLRLDQESSHAHANAQTGQILTLSNVQKQALCIYICGLHDRIRSGPSLHMHEFASSCRSITVPLHACFLYTLRLLQCVNMPVHVTARVYTHMRLWSYMHTHTQNIASASALRSSVSKSQQSIYLPSAERTARCEACMCTCWHVCVTWCSYLHVCNARQGWIRVRANMAGMFVSAYV
jgi:hypothetical protein